MLASFSFSSPCWVYTPYQQKVARAILTPSPSRLRNNQKMGGGGTLKLWVKPIPPAITNQGCEDLHVLQAARSLNKIFAQVVLQTLEVTFKLSWLRLDGTADLLAGHVQASSQ